MKKLLLSLFTTFCLASAFAQYQGFENWTADSILTLDDYQTGVLESYFHGTVTTSISTDAQLGARSIKLETKLTAKNDTLFGYFLSGDPDAGAAGQAVTLPNVDSIIGYYKCNIMPNDSALMLCQLSMLGTATGGGMFYFTTSQSAWKRFAFPVNAASCDSLLFAIASSDAINDFNGVPGTWIQVDNIQLKSSSGTLAPIQNHSFENWSSIVWETPVGWETSAIYGIGEATLPAIKTTDKYSGNFAIELTTITNSHNDTIGGVATNGELWNNGNVSGVPLASKPNSIECYYKYTPVGADTAYISFQFFNGGSVVESLGGAYSNTVNTYTKVSYGFSTLSPIDTMLITFYSGENPGSKLKIDAIDLVYPIGVNELIKIEKVVSYPNPVTDNLNVKFTLNAGSDVSIRLIDITGKEITKRSLGDLTSGEYYESFNTSDYNAGVYFLEFTLGNDVITNKIIINK